MHLRDHLVARPVRLAILGITLLMPAPMEPTRSVGSVHQATIPVVRMKKVAPSVLKGLTGAVLGPSNAKHALSVNQGTMFRVIVLQ